MQVIILGGIYSYLALYIMEAMLGIESRKVTAPAPSNCANEPINAVITQTIITLPLVININRFTKGLNNPLSVIMPKDDGKYKHYDNVHNL